MEAEPAAVEIWEIEQRDELSGRRLKRVEKSDGRHVS